MATERSTHDVKAQRGLGMGRGGEGKRKKSICGDCYRVFRWNEDQAQRKGTDRVCGQPPVAAPASVRSRRGRPPRAAPALLSEEQMPQTKTPLERQSVSASSTSSAFCRQQGDKWCDRVSKQTRMVITSEEERASESRRDPGGHWHSTVPLLCFPVLYKNPNKYALSQI